MITCPNCGELNGEVRETCWKCGKSLNNPQGVERRAICSPCSNIYTTAARYCPAAAVCSVISPATRKPHD